MSENLFWLGEAQMERRRPLLPDKGSLGSARGRLAGDLGDHPRPEVWLPVARRAYGLRIAQDALEPMAAVGRWS